MRLRANLVLQSTFNVFDVDKKGYIETDMIGTIMDLLGTQISNEELEVSIQCSIFLTIKVTG